jgi:RNA polymerase sigma-70 factor (sigma-E family)
LRRRCCHGNLLVAAGSLNVVDSQPRREMLAELYARHYPELVRVAFALTGDWALAEDLAQEVFVRAWRSWGRLRQEQSAQAYLRVIVVNLARTSLRRQLRDLRARRAASWPGWAGADETDPEVGVDMVRLLARLPIRKRACVVLRFYLDLSEADTAAALGVSVGTVKSQTAKALRALRGWLAEDDSVPRRSTATREAADES